MNINIVDNTNTSGKENEMSSQLQAIPIRLNNSIFCYTIALHLAVVSKDREIIARMLIENGANLNVVNNNGLTPLESAIDTCENKNFEHSQI